MRLQGKVSIITGASGGIGEATANKFAAEGAIVVLADVRQEAVQQLASLIEASGGTSLGLAVDVTNRASVEQLMTATVEKYGRIDVVVNNAGITDDATLLKMTEDQWDRVLNVNLKGVFNVAQAAAKWMKAQNGGVILNASSVVGIYGNFGQTNYAAAKWGVNGMTKTWAKELGKYGIRVNAIAPGFIHTPMTQKMPDNVIEMMVSKSVLGRMGSPADIANGYAFLASDEAAFMTGAILNIDGGIVL